MLSILLPVYNFKIFDLVNNLSNQCINLKIEHEILCYDDKSNKSFLEDNKTVKNIENVSYKELKKNIGRSKIRNLLAKNSKFENLLFLDCDIDIIDENYIQNYLTHSKDYKVIVGGVAYSEFKDSRHFYLRWKYGKNREEKLASKRRKQVYRAFSACNLMIKKSVFKTIHFSEKLSKYGHEDTMFGLELKENKISVLHIENPVYHKGLDNNSMFIQKTEDSLDNLLLISKHVKLNNDVKIFTYYKLVKNTLFITYPVFAFIKTTLKKKFLKGNSNLMLFDLYKLSYLLCSKNI